MHLCHRSCIFNWNHQDFIRFARQINMFLIKEPIVNPLNTVAWLLEHSNKACYSKYLFLLSTLALPAEGGQELSLLGQSVRIDLGNWPTE